MENIKYSKTLRKNWEIVALFMGVAVVFALIISLLQPFQYAANTQMLIIQKQVSNLDAYTATKSAEKVAKNLARIMYTSSFYNEVIDNNPQIEKHFSKDSLERKKAWKKNVKIGVVPETGLLEIKVLDTDKSYAAEVVKSIAYVLVSKGVDYHGAGTDIQIKIIDDIYVGKFPAKPNIILNSTMAVLLGFIFGSAFVVLNEARKIEKFEQALEKIEVNVSEEDVRKVVKDSEKEFDFEAEELAESAQENNKVLPIFNQDEDEQEFYHTDDQKTVYEPDMTENDQNRNDKIITMHDHLEKLS